MVCAVVVEVVVDDVDDVDVVPLIRPVMNPNASLYSVAPCEENCWNCVGLVSAYRQVVWSKNWVWPVTELNSSIHIQAEEYVVPDSL